MKLTKKIETEVLKVYDSWLHAYLNGDVAIYDQYLDDAYHFIGSTNNEEFLDRNATTNFFEATADQLAGKCQLKEEKKTVEAFGDLVFITHVFDAWFLNGSQWTYYSRFRFSSVVQEKKTGWRFIYQHFSTTDNKADAGETIGFDKVTLENQELREAIKRRTVELEAKNRELEIEGALERIRAQAVAMQQSSDLLDIVVTMRNEFTKLGHEAHYFWHMMWLPETYEKAMTSDDGSKIGFVMTLPRHMHGDIPLLANWEESDDATVIYPMNVKAAISYVDKMVNLINFKNIDPQAPTHDDIKHIGGLTFIMARTTHGEIGYSLPGVIKNPPAEDLDILVQFAGAFDLAHRRFLDLQKAEKQAREVQIELALEKVRSRTMAMHKTDELREVAAVLYKEIESLHMSAYGFELILFKPEKDLLEYWTVPPNYEFTERYKIHRNTHPVFEKQWVAWENKEERLVIKLKGQELDNFNSVLFSETDFRNFPEAVKLKIFEKEVTTFSHAYMRYGFLEAIDNKQLSENDFSIISRFAKVFEQTYTRFLDIQKAEKQAREAQIEGALERVRSRSLAMYNSEELLAVIEVVSEQLRLLDLKFDTISFGKNYQESDFKFWLTSSGQPKPVLIQVPFFDSRVLKSVIEAQKKEIDFIADVFTKEENRAWLAHMIQFSALKNFPEHVKDFILNSPGFARSSFLMQHIDLYVGNYRAMPFTDEENAIFKRFAQVFSQAYTRFLDLQKAEDQARESQIQLSLERVRAKSMAMQSSSELENIIQVVHDQFVDLGITLDHAGFIIDYKSNDDMIIWLADEHKVTPQIRLPYFDSPHWNSFITAKKQGHKLFVNHLDFKTKNKFYKQIFKYIPELPEDARHFYLKIPSLTIATALIDTIGLYIENFSGVQYQEEDQKILFRFGEEFQQAFTRFLDLQKAEAQAREAQIQLSLERVRAKSMAMQSSDELHDVIGIVFQQFDNLAIQPVNVFLSLFDREKRMLTYRASGKSGKRMPTKQDVDIDSVEAWTDLYNKWINDSSDDIEVIFYPKEIVPDILNLLKATFLAMPKKDRMTTKDFPNGGYSTLGYTPFGYLGYDHTRPPTEEEKDILKRICTEFGRVYQRFLDIKKAEAQAREAQIEASLERVRAKAMAMHQSSELSDVLKVLFNQFDILGVNPVFAHLSLIDLESNTFTYRMTGRGGKRVLTKQVIDLNARDEWKDSVEAFKEGKPNSVSCLHFPKEALPQIWELFHETLGALPKGAKIYQKDFPDGLYNTQGYCKFGYLGFNHNRPATEEEKDIVVRFAKEFGRLYQRFLDIEKAEAQAREAQIEASLERVRAKAMAMHQTDELTDVLCVLFDQFDILGINPVLTHLTLFDEENETFSLRITTTAEKRIVAEQYIDINAVEAWKDSFANWKKSEPNAINCIDYKPEALPYVWDLLSEVMNALPEGHKIKPTDFPGGLFTTQGHFKFGYIGYNHSQRATEEEKEIVGRFAREFGRTYQRFLDLKKAEAQAREAQIEMALERVRSRTMAMQNSEELEEVILVVLKKLQGLGISMEQRAAAICTYEAGNKDYTQWVASPEYNSILSFNTPYFDHPVQNDIWNARQNRTDFYAKPYPVEVKNSLFKYLFDLPALKNMPQAEKTKALNFKHYSISIAFQKHASLVVVDHSGVPLTEAENSILVRLNYVFHQTYTRFLDLQKAEAQAREAQIEAALEKVRSRSMGMQKSTELLEVILVVSEQLQALGFRFSTASFLNNNLEDDYSFWVAPYGLPEPVRFTLPYKDIPMIRKLRNAQKKKLSFFTDVSSIKEHQQWFQHLLDYSKENTYTKEIIDYQMSKGLARSVSIHPNIMLAIANNQSLPYSDYENKIIARFGQVFEQSYTRFLDLEKAEAQAREAQIEAALEKVRSRSLEMSESSEMQNVANEILEQVRAVGLKIDALAMSGVIDNDSDYDVWVGGANSKKPLRIPYNNETQVQREFNKAIKERPEFFAKTYTGKVMKDYFKALMGTGNSFNPEIVAFMKTCTGFTTTLTFMKNSGIQLIRYSEEAFSKEDNAVIVRFGRVFEQAYIRFLDLQKAEEQTLLAQQNLIRLQTQKQRAEEALSELQQTQTQLIQSEKMASLGELTAGIAHEIQNPLNFVNNFSEVSKELLVEMQEEIENGDFEEVKAIMEDVIQNLEKINHHGKRADGIVKGMLQHSRSSSGTKEPTDINALADEYLRLAYHGLRAKDKSFNAELVTDFDDTIGKIHVVPQDIGRVILNLITNAFYAVNEKKQQDEDFKPMVSVSTKKTGDYLEIKVTDNGNGIPKEVVDKIFQPFFTTKPTGQGTGLGLSMSYDIVNKGHGGELSVTTKEGEGTSFIIDLPIQNKVHADATKKPQI
jgi:signal transduction histidine kinase/ketosteroid isomerase-like protein